MRADLGRLGAEGLQVGSSLAIVDDGRARPTPGSSVRDGAVALKLYLLILRTATALVLLTAPAFAQVPNINLMPELPSKSPEEREQDRIRDKAYRDSLRKIPDTKVSSDPWGAVRSTDTPKAVKSKARTGGSAN